MPRYPLRASSSGPRALPTQARGLNGWNAGSNLTIDILPAGHREGLYSLAIQMFVLTAAGAGNFNNSVLAWDMPGFGAVTNAFVPTAPTTTGSKLSSYREIPSTGLSPIQFRIIVNGITGSPIIDVGGYAELIAFNP